MLAVFTKPLELVTPADVAELTAEAWPEGYEVEFKKALPQKKGGTHAWTLGGDDIGEHARDEILSEVVAFANAQGGSLVLGVEETKDKPPRAVAINPLPRVGELARRFEDQARSCIDPPLPGLRVRAVEMDGNSGVVIFRTTASRAAPASVDNHVAQLCPSWFEYIENDHARDPGHDPERGSRTRRNRADLHASWELVPLLAR